MNPITIRCYQLFPNENEACALHPATPPHTPEVISSRATTKPNTKIKVSAKKTAADETPAPKANKSVAVTVPASLEKAVDVVAKMQAY